MFIGHVDAGKSTTAGQILFLTGGVDDRTIEKCGCAATAGPAARLWGASGSPCRGYAAVEAAAGGR